MVRICRVRQTVRDQVRRVRAEGFKSSAAIARLTGSFTSPGSDEDLLQCKGAKLERIIEVSPN
jgi:hypothetical protein